MSDLERLTVNLIPRASKALAEACTLTGYSKTDAVNRAVQLYNDVEKALAAGGKIGIEQGGKRETWHLL